MTYLTVFPDTDATNPTVQTEDPKVIEQTLAQHNVLFERWIAHTPITKDADQAAIMQAYEHDIERLKALGGYQTVDVVSLFPDNPNKIELRKKFLDEHIHTEDEVRFFVRGRGVFYLHSQQQVVAVLCEQGDLISVPARTAHWFDMGADPEFTAIRFFNNEEGWVAQHTGDTIADQFPRYEMLQSTRLS